MERAEHWKSKEVSRLLALVETERRYYQEMVTNLPVSVAVLNTQFCLVAANRVFRQNFGIKSDDLRKRCIDQIFSSTELQARIQSVFESGIGSRPLVIERTVAEHAKPQRLRVSVQAFRDWDEDGSLQALLVIEELDGSATVEPAVEVSALPDPLPCVIWTARAADRTFTLVSPSAKTLLEIDPQDWVESATAFGDRIHPDDRPRTLAFYDQSLENPGFHSCEFRMRKPGAWYRETILVGAGAGSISGCITDVTARRTVEEQLLQSQRMDAIGTLAGRIAHDINNPLMIVNGYAEDLAEAFPTNDPRGNDMREIQTAGKRIGELTGHLQAVTRKHALAGGTVELAGEFGRVIERMRAAAGEYLHAESVPSSQPLAVIAEAGQLEAVLLELSAALVEGGGESAHLTLSALPVRVTELVRGEQPLLPGDYVEISIINKSRKSPQLTVRVFESLVPGKDPGREAGPALARTFKTVQEWGGTIQSLPDNNEFRVYLRSANAPPEELPETAPTVVPLHPKPLEFVRKSSILIVEDEPGIRALMRKILQREGFEVHEAASGVEAIQLLKQKGPVNLLITDVMMPGMTGRQLAEQVQSMDSNCGILYMSGFTSDTGVETGQFPPGSHFLQKPFTLGSLLRKANEVLASTPRRSA